MNYLIFEKEKTCVLSFLQPSQATIPSWTPDTSSLPWYVTFSPPGSNPRLTSFLGSLLLVQKAPGRYFIYVSWSFLTCAWSPGYTVCFAQWCFSTRLSLPCKLSRVGSQLKPRLLSSSDLHSSPWILLISPKKQPPCPLLALQSHRSAPAGHSWQHFQQRKQKFWGCENQIYLFGCGTGWALENLKIPVPFLASFRDITNLTARHRNGFHA